VRHKILDCVGDLYLAGAPISGHFEGYRSGHAMNHAIVRALFADPTAWRYVNADTTIPEPELLRASA
jgi:UDP-3-O-[3-hydroxymyristoyl] N-acetylglucosamine deacetylase